MSSRKNIIFLESGGVKIGIKYIVRINAKTYFPYVHIYIYIAFTFLSDK